MNSGTLHCMAAFAQIVSYYPSCTVLGCADDPMADEVMAFVPQHHLYPRFLVDQLADLDMIDPSLRLARLRDTLATFDLTQWRREPNQIELHERFIKACVPAIYGDQLEEAQEQLLAENGWVLPWAEDTSCEGWTRRSGQTTARAMFLAAYLLTQRPVSVLCMCISTRQGNRFLQYILDMTKVLVTKLQLNEVACHRTDFHNTIAVAASTVKCYTPAEYKRLHGIGF